MNVARALIYLKIREDDYLMHKDGSRKEQINPSSLVLSVRHVQRVAGSFPIMTLTDLRASSVTALARAQVDPALIMTWGGWAVDNLKSYYRSNVPLKKKLQGVLDA